MTYCRVAVAERSRPGSLEVLNLPREPRFETLCGLLMASGSVSG